uniref:Craniofacial development protein 2-like n=1 Tax=Nicotiana tabacum TaxID=4097 RepID=A0A1S3YE58_TOBAC|nr:PREDICTED: craniofacial development protein 2-like [Nicotiana tabacum]
MRDMGSFKLWYSGRMGDRNRVGILVDKNLRELVVEVMRVNDKLMTIKLVVGGFTLNIISAYAPQEGLDEESKRRFWEDLDEMVCGIPHTEKLLIGGDFNSHIGATSNANSSFSKKREHLVTFRSSVAETQIDYLLCRKSDRGLCTDFKVILSQNLSTLHRLLFMDLEITRKRRKRAMYIQHKIKWGA